MIEVDRLICFKCIHFRPLSGGCDAFPNGIPYAITEEGEGHDAPFPEQENDIIFEEGVPQEGGREFGERKTGLKENPYHDELGQFTDEAGDAGGGGGGGGGGGDGDSEIQSTMQGFGINASSVDASNLKPEQAKEYHKQLNNLSKEYDSPYDKADKVIFKSGKDIIGQIKYNKDGSVGTINFGNRSDYGSGNSHAKIDASKAHLHTITHETGHLITGRAPTNWLIDHPKKEFWQGAARIRGDYMREGKQTLGKYASTSVEEFVAEAFTEYKLNSKPSKYGKALGEHFDKHFKKKK